MRFIEYGGGGGMRSMAVKKRRWIQPSVVAEYFGVTFSTIRGWVSCGKLRAAKLPTGHLRILARDVVRTLLERGKPVPSELGGLAGRHVLVVDSDAEAAQAVAAALREVCGCKVTVADSAPVVRGLLNGARPDAIVLRVRRRASSRNGDADLFILGHVADGLSDPAPDGRWAFDVNDILPPSADGALLASRLAGPLFG